MALKLLAHGLVECLSCGHNGLPRIDAGTGPHYQKASCQACGRFVQWLPKPKEERMTASVNRVVLLGRISTDGVEVRYTTTGSPCTSFTLAVAEMAQNGKEYTTLIPCEVWGKKAEMAGECEANQLVVFEGKIRRRRKDDQQWELVVSGFDLTPVWHKKGAA